MVDYIKEAEYEVAMLMMNIVASEYMKNPKSEYFTIHLPALQDMIAKIPNNFKGRARLNYLLGSDDLIQTANTMTGIGGVGSTAYSAACFVTTKNPVARCFYVAGGSCSVIGAGLSAYSTFTSNSTSCAYSFVGLFAVGSGATISFIGKRIIDVADIVEGKPKKPNWWGRRLRHKYQGGGYRGVAFTLPPYIERIPYGKIFTGGMVIVTVYGYSKFIIATYRRGQRLIYNFQLRRRSQLIKEQADYLVNSFPLVQKFNRQKFNRIYKLASCC